jgi:hypothetical protein
MAQPAPSVGNPGVWRRDTQGLHEGYVAAMGADALDSLHGAQDKGNDGWFTFLFSAGETESTGALRSEQKRLKKQHQRNGVTFNARYEDL